MKFIVPSDLESDISIKGGTSHHVFSSLGLDANRFNKDTLGTNFDQIQHDIDQMTLHLKQSIASDHPVLNSASNYFFNISGKKTRPLIVLLLSAAANLHRDPIVKQNQSRLSEIAEMIHVASLIHDDIIDESDMRRGQPALHAAFGNKVAVLAGDFLLSRASVSLTKLGNIEVIRLISATIEHLAHGEIWQMAGIGTSSFQEYMMKSYYKTASLIAASCQSSSILANCSSEIIESSYLYGKHLGLAYQLVDDSLDFTGNAELLGKPAHGADLKLGLTTAPVHFACKEFPILNEMIKNKFSGENDVERTIEFVSKSGGVEKTKILAATHIKRSIQALSTFQDSPWKDSLIYLAGLTLDRIK
jgi:solanesyl diphosphate synthase